MRRTATKRAARRRSRGHQRVAAGAVALALYLVQAGAVLAQAPPDVVAVAYEAAARERVWDGRLDAINQGTVSAQTSGRIEEIFFDVDDFVESGTVIMRFTDVEQRANLAQARAALAEAEARAEGAAAEFQRIQNMYQNETVSRARFDQAQANNAAAKARLQGARSQVTSAEEQLEYTKVRAPYPGIVSRRLVEVGESVRPGQPLMSGLSLDALRVTVDVPQTMLEPIRMIGEAYIYAGNERLEGMNLTFFPVADPASNTFRVRMDLPPVDVQLYPGMLVKVGFVVGQSQRLLIPQAAVVRRSELTAVYVVDGERVMLRQIRAGRRYGERVEVLAGLTEGEFVARDPVAAGIYLKGRSK